VMLERRNFMKMCHFLLYIFSKNIFTQVHASWSILQTLPS
jgi:hypothetical protein